MKKQLLIAAFAAAISSNVWAGGLLTNTNQSVSFLRNPAREGAIAIDGVYSNPAGVAFLNEGLHLNINWQAAWQKRKIETQNNLFALGVNNNGATTKNFEGTAKAPFIPSIQAAYNTGKWSFQFGFSVNGGGGKCEFANGLGSFESAVGKIAGGLRQFGTAVNYPDIVNGYSADSYMQGKQFYFGFTLGAAYKLIDEEKQKLSVYGGIRALYGKASYKAKISNIMVYTTINPNGQKFQDYYPAIKPYISGINTQCEQAIAYYKASNIEVPADVAANYKSTAQLLAIEPYATNDGVNLQSDQEGIGFAPIFGVDYMIGNFNFAAKYEFRTKMSMENESTVHEAHAIEAVNQFQDGTSIREDAPSLLALGAQWSALPNLRINAGYHHFYDKASKKYGNKQELLSGGTNEYLGGVEYDINDKLTISGGAQITKYGLTDEYMNDMSFVVDSWSFGLGAKYKVTDKVAVELAYFQTNYDDYKQKNADANGCLNQFTRENRVIAAGVSIDF